MAFESERKRELRRLCTRGGRVKHRTRDVLQPGDTLHVTLKVHAHVPSLRRKRVIQEFERCFRAAKEREGFRLLQYAVMSNHLHLIVEADDRRSLSRGMQGLNIRLAKAIQRLFGLTGQIFRDRYFARMLKFSRDVHRVLRYVIQNARRHGIPLPAGEYDPFSSARYCRQCGSTPREDPRDWPVHWLPSGHLFQGGGCVPADYVPGFLTG